MTHSALVVGFGGGGSRLVAGARRLLGVDCLVVSPDHRDAVDGCRFVHVPCRTLANPSVHAIRGAAGEVAGLLRAHLAGYDTVIMAANLAGRSGAALAPMVSAACRDLGKQAISFVIMPFRYEKDRIFNAGVSLRRIRRDSACTIILDNDSMLECNPDLDQQSCYMVGNGALFSIMDSLGRADISGDCIVSAGRPRASSEESLRDSIKMLYETAPPRAVKRSILYITGSAPVGVIESVSRLTEGITDAPVEVVSGGAGPDGVVLASATGTVSKFDEYDPLGVIPEDRVLDWDDPDSSANIDLDLYRLP